VLVKVADVEGCVYLYDRALTAWQTSKIRAKTAQGLQEKFAKFMEKALHRHHNAELHHPKLQGGFTDRVRVLRMIAELRDEHGMRTLAQLRAV
jgi:hypothetical protein